MIALIVLVLYIGSGLLLARYLYRGLRPLSVPASCDSTSSYHKHDSWCYRQAGAGKAWMIDSQGEAAVFALLGGLLWPFMLLGMSLRWAVIAGNDRQSPEELQARIRELESQLGIKP